MEPLSKFTTGRSRLVKKGSLETTCANLIKATKKIVGQPNIRCTNAVFDHITALWYARPVASGTVRLPFRRLLGRHEAARHTRDRSQMPSRLLPQYIPRQDDVQLSDLFGNPQVSSSGKLLHACWEKRRVLHKHLQLRLCLMTAVTVRTRRLLAVNI